MGYAVSDLAPRQNIDLDRIVDSESATRAMSLHFYDNFHNLGHYLQNPDTTSLYGRDGTRHPRRHVAVPALRGGSPRRL
jgi:hypothetical protein